MPRARNGDAAVDYPPHLRSLELAEGLAELAVDLLRAESGPSPKKRVKLLARQKEEHRNSVLRERAQWDRMTPTQRKAELERLERQDAELEALAMRISKEAFAKEAKAARKRAKAARKALAERDTALAAKKATEAPPAPPAKTKPADPNVIPFPDPGRERPRRRRPRAGGYSVPSYLHDDDD